MMICALVGATIIQVNAQREKTMDRSPEKQAERMTQMMAERLDLNEDQKKEIHALHLEQAQKRKAERESTKESMEARREAMKAEREAHHEKIAGILTEEQKEKWEALKEEGRQKMQERRRGPGKRDSDQGRKRGPRSSKPTDEQ
ncbi:MAG: DUF4890 domain-containing protein [Cyclobacteriaceae bacterium]